MKPAANGRPPDGLLLRALAALCALSALVHLAIVIYSASLGVRTADWPSTRGVMLRSTWQVTSGRNTYKTPDVRYRYQVNGAEFEGDRLQFGPTVFVADRLRALPEGSAQRVYFDRANPARSTLTAGIVWPTLIVFALACVLSLAAACFFWRLLKRRLRPAD